MFPILEKPAGAIDPVCGMSVDPARAAGKSTYQGKDRYFCSKGCLAKFEADPEKYLHPVAEPEPMSAPMSGQPDSTIYTCPMHPEVRKIGPGSCPKCGMALEPVTLTLSSADQVNPEYAAMLRRFWFSFPLATALLAMMFLGAHQPWLELALAAPVVLWGGWPIFERGWASVVNRHLHMFTLIAL